MPNGQRWTPVGERACLAGLFAWLMILPLPFGSVIDEARPLVVAVPLALGILAALLRLHATRDRTDSAQPTRPWVLWGVGALSFIAFVALQLVPLPPAVVAALSPEAAAIWRAAAKIATLAGGAPRPVWPLSVDPHATVFELFRLAGLLAAFTTAALLIRTHARRQALALTLCVAATFQAAYGIREAALDRYAIWGWINRLIFDRVTGTFVNPNHFGHYLALIVPMALFIVAVRWHRAGGPESSAARRFAQIMEGSLFTVGMGVLAVLACAAGILLSQSRGALLALAIGLLIVAAMLPGRGRSRVLLGAIALGLIFFGLVLVFGAQRTISRFAASSEAVSSRRVGISAAFGIWERFAITGSGAGTFERVVSMEQSEHLHVIYHHAHNDYAEIAATTGTVGFLLAMATLFGGYVALIRMTFSDAASEVSWSRRAFQVAALASLTVAMTHALFDFNFFIPANPATLAAIMGASVASIDHDRRSRR